MARHHQAGGRCRPAALRICATASSSRCYHSTVADALLHPLLAGPVGLSCQTVSRWSVYQAASLHILLSLSLSLSPQGGSDFNALVKALRRHADGEEQSPGSPPRKRGPASPKKFDKVNGYSTPRGFAVSPPRCGWSHRAVNVHFQQYRWILGSAQESNSSLL